MSIAPLPTRRDEPWRYSNIDALTRVWDKVDSTPVRIRVPAGQRASFGQDHFDSILGVSLVPLEIEVEAGGHYSAHFLLGNADAELGRIALDVRLHDGAHFELGAVILGDGKQTLELVTHVAHAAANATSRQTVRMVMANKATGSYLGKVAVARDAQKTDSVQSVKAMLLDRTATANAKPELEIYADDVKCAHGASVGELDKDALFYLAARGIAPAEAKAMLLQAFIASAFEGAADEDALTKAALAKLGEMV